MPRYGELFASSEFRALFSSQVVSMLGDVVAAVALTVLVFERTGSPALAAGTFSLAFVPYLIGGMLYGSIVDRFPARPVLVACNLASALLVGLMVLPFVPIALVLVLLALVSFISPLFSSVRVATLGDVLPGTGAVILGRSLLRVVSQVIQVAGNGVGGLLLIVLSPRGVLAIDAASFVVSALLLRFGTRHRPRRVAQPSGSLLADSLGGLRVMLREAPLRRLLLFGWLLPTCTAAPEALAAPYTHEIGQPASAVGVYLLGLPAGTALANLVAARFARPAWQQRLFIPGALLTALPLLAFALRPGLGVAVAVLFVAGLGSVYAPGFDRRLFAATDEQRRGRVLATYTAGLIGFQGVGFAFWGSSPSSRRRKS